MQQGISVKFIKGKKQVTERNSNEPYRNNSNKSQNEQIRNRLKVMQQFNSRAKWLHWKGLNKFMTTIQPPYRMQMWHCKIRAVSNIHIIIMTSFTESPKKFERRKFFSPAIRQIWRAWQLFLARSLWIRQWADPVRLSSTDPASCLCKLVPIDLPLSRWPREIWACHFSTWNPWQTNWPK